jgi:hypothetical protein
VRMQRPGQPEAQRRARPLPCVTAAMLQPFGWPRAALPLRVRAAVRSAPCAPWLPFCERMSIETRIFAGVFAPQHTPR